jgi:hypothetical protein
MTPEAKYMQKSSMHPLIFGILLLVLSSGAIPLAVSADPGPEVIDIHLHLVRTEVETSDDGWQVVWQGSQILSLEELLANMNAVLGSDPFAPGVYTGLRLLLGDLGYVTVEDQGVARRVQLSVPSGQQTGLKMDELFEVGGGKLLQLDMDFDPSALRYQQPQDRFVLRSTFLTITGSRELDAVATVGPEGGMLTTLDGRLQLTVPPGALSHRETIEVKRLEEHETPPLLPENISDTLRRVPIGAAYQLTSSVDSGFSAPVTLSIRYDEDEIQEVNEFQLGIHVFDESTGLWDRVGGFLEPEENFTLVELAHFSTYRVIAVPGGLVLGSDDREVVDSRLQQNDGFGPTQHIGFTDSGCTGFLISNNLFMTHYACFRNGWCGFPLVSEVSFNRIIDPLNTTQAGEPDVFRCNQPRLLLPDLGVVVVELFRDGLTNKSAGSIWGHYQLDSVRREARAYAASHPSDRVLAPRKLWIDRRTGCSTRVPTPLEAVFFQADMVHGCDIGPGGDGAPIVDFVNRNRVQGIHRSHGSFLWHSINTYTSMAAVIPHDDINGNSVLDMVEIDLTGGLVDPGFRTCVPGLDGACIIRWFLPFRIELTARGGLAPYTWSAGGDLPETWSLSSTGILEGPATFCFLCDHRVQVTVTDSLGVSATKTIVVHSGL